MPRKSQRKWETWRGIAFDAAVRIFAVRSVHDSARDARWSVCGKAHIRPLGRPHSGPDVPENVLCLCPNCHVLFHQGAITVNDDFSLQGAAGKLRLHPQHLVDVVHVRYHRKHYGG